MAKEIELDAVIQKISRKSHPVAVFAAGALVLAAMNVARVRLREKTLERQAELSELAEATDESSDSFNDASSLREMKLRDLERFKTELAKLTKSRRALFEGGCSYKRNFGFWKSSGRLCRRIFWWMKATKRSI